MIRWISEKFDGIRAQFDGKMFYTRNKQCIRPPDSFLQNMPATANILDGELWLALTKMKLTLLGLEEEDLRNVRQ
jgi:DNA ligase-1